MRGHGTEAGEAAAAQRKGVFWLETAPKAGQVAAAVGGLLRPMASGRRRGCSWAGC